MTVSNGQGTKLYVGTHNGACVLNPSGAERGWEKAGVVSLDHAAARLAPSSTSTERAYLAAYESGVWRTDDGGGSWNQLKSYPTDYAHSVGVDPEDADLVYAGSEPAALYRSTDGGNSWEECAGFTQVPESSKWEFHGARKSHVRDLRISSSDRGLIYAGIEVGGVVRSRDGGLTWKQLPGTDPDVHSLHISLSRPETVYAATAIGPYRSDDGGDTWNSIHEGLERRYSVPVASAPDDHRRVLVAVSDNAGRRSGARAYLSTDAGESWQLLDLGSYDDMVVVYTWDPLDSDLVYAGTDSGKLFLSTDQGETWARLGVSLDSIAVGALVAVPVG